MHKKTGSIFLSACLALLIVVMAGCRTPRATVPASASASPTGSQVGIGKTPASTQIQATLQITSPHTSPVAQLTNTSPPSTVEATGTGYPVSTATSTQATPGLLAASPTSQEYTKTPTAVTTSAAGYPGPQETETQPNPVPQGTENQAYPGPQLTSTTQPSTIGTTPTPSATPKSQYTRPPSATPGGTISPSPTLKFGTGTPALTPTELPPRLPLSPPTAGSNVSIWSSWGISETETLRSLIRSFQRSYPDVTFDLTSIPEDDLFSRFQKAAYLGQGPSILFGPAEWGPQLYNGQLVVDLTPYIPDDYLSRLNPAALASGRNHQALVSLPLSQHGIVMFRNTAVIASAPATFDELSELSQEATHGGVVGSYLERGAYFSAPNLLSLGGSLMDDNFKPTFNDLAGVKWFDLLQAYDHAGAVTFNTNRDLDMFKRGRVGIIIDGTWNINTLSQAIGADKLAIDPWPAFGDGHMSGWVQADSMFLNANVTGDDRFAALAFIGYLLDPDVQQRLAEVGHIPSVTTTHPRNLLIQQAMEAFSLGVPYPVGVDQGVLNIYWSALNTSIRSVFVGKVAVDVALKSASNEISQTLIDFQLKP